MFDGIDGARIGRERLQQEHVGTIHVHWEVSAKMDASESSFKEQLNTWFWIKSDRAIRQFGRALFVRFHCHECNALPPTTRAALDLARREAREQLAPCGIVRCTRNDWWNFARDVTDTNKGPLRSSTLDLNEVMEQFIERDLQRQKLSLHTLLDGNTMRNLGDARGRIST